MGANGSFWRWNARRGGVFASGLALLVLLGICGCASPGPLRPPTLNLPAPVRGLTADRVGDTVSLRWTNPTRTTDGLLLARKHGSGPLQAEICRVEIPSAATCAPVTRTPANSGEAATFQDQLPPSLATGAVRPLRYRVRVLNGQGAGAAYAEAVTLAGQAPPPLQDVTAEPVGNGVLLRWRRAELVPTDRVQLHVLRGVEPASAATESRTPREVVLAVDPLASRAGGTLDTGAKMGVAQSYSIALARTLRTGGEELSMTGPAALVTVAADAKVPPPEPPAGVEALVNTLGTLQMDLVWQPVANAVGYTIYRAEGSGAAVPLTGEPVQGMTYTDSAVVPGRAYRYSIVAVGSSGAASGRSREVLARVPASGSE